MVHTTIFLSPDRASASSALLLPAVALDGGYDTGGALEAKDGFLQLSVDDIAVGHDQHRVEHLLVRGVVQVGQEVSRPGDGVGFPRSGRMLDEVFMSRAFFEDGSLQFAGGVELMIARKNYAFQLFLIVALSYQDSAQGCLARCPAARHHSIDTRCGDRRS